MNKISNEIPERLYLSRENNNEIYINNCQTLRKIQISGIRYLYKLFKKKKLGVIFNHPSDSGQSVSVALFIEAVLVLLTAPVLILCNNDSELQYWKQIFLNWTNFTEDDLSLESAYPLVKKKISIKKATDLNSYLRRKWSVLVLKNDEIPKEINKLKFDVDFKIWITSVDMYHDLTMLSTGLNWIDPKLSINIKDFETRHKCVKEVVQILTRLEAFTEDIVIRTDNVKSILKKTTDVNVNTESSVSKKNKDATGAKIKKSKRKIYDDTDEVPSSSKNTKVTVMKHHSSIPDGTSKETSKMNTISINIVGNEDNENSNKYNRNVIYKSLKHTSNDETCTDDKSSPSLINMNEFIHNLDEHPIPEQNIDNNFKTNNEMKELNSKVGNDNAIVFRHTNDDQLSVSNHKNDIINVDFTSQSPTYDNNTEPLIKTSVKDEHVHKSLIGETKDVETELDVNDVKNNVRNDIVLNETKNNARDASALNNALNTSIDKKLSALEEHTLNKYKGSILDSIF